MMDICWLYRRCSKKTQDTYSQQPELLRYAEKEGILQALEVEDYGTGKNMVRKGIQGILKAIRSGTKGKLVVVSINRLGRNAREVLEVVELCDKFGIPIVSLREKIDSSTPMGRCMIAMVAALAQLENEQRSEATKAGIDAKKEYCLKNGLEYKHGGSAKGYSLKVTQAKADAILALKAKGYSYRAIAKEVGISDKTVRTVVLNPRPQYMSRSKLALEKKLKKK